MLIRTMKPEDVDQVVAIEEASFSQPWSRNGFLDVLDNKETLFLVAAKRLPDSPQHTIFGYICIYLMSDECEITNVAVAEDSRRQGIGELLLSRAIQECRRLGVKRFVLEARVSNKPAIRLYEKMGFVTVGVRRDFYEFPKEDARIMALEEQA